MFVSTAYVMKHNGKVGKFEILKTVKPVGSANFTE